MSLKTKINKLLDQVHNNQLVPGYDLSVQATVNHDPDREYEPTDGDFTGDPTADTGVEVIQGPFSKDQIANSGGEILLTDIKMVIRRNRLSLTLTQTAEIMIGTDRHQIISIEERSIGADSGVTDYVVQTRRY